MKLRTAQELTEFKKKFAGIYLYDPVLVDTRFAKNSSLLMTVKKILKSFKTALF
jgi:hypothetical protein